jgi:hypothetical protein
VPQQKVVSKIDTTLNMFKYQFICLAFLSIETIDNHHLPKLLHPLYFVLAERLEHGSEHQGRDVDHLDKE